MQLPSDQRVRGRSWNHVRTAGRIRPISANAARANPRPQRQPAFVQIGPNNGLSGVGNAVEFFSTVAFFVNLTAPLDATLAVSQGLGTIVNDDGPVGVALTQQSDSANLLLAYITDT